MLTTCCQDGCVQPPIYRFTWPGVGERVICAVHVARLRKVASAVGLDLQLIPLHLKPGRAAPDQP